MDENPLRYRLKPEGAFVLYSIGEDGKHKGGDGSLADNKRSDLADWRRETVP